jgi:hypothetical protein
MTTPEITYLQDLANRYGDGTIAKAYNAKLGWGIIRTTKGTFMMFNEYGYSGECATLALAVAEYDRMERGNAAYCKAHGF